MGVIVPEGFSNVTLLWLSNGAPRYKTISFGVTGPIADPDDAQTIADNMFGYFTAAGRPCVAANMVNTWSFEGVSVTQTVDGFPVLGQHFVHIQGTKTGPSDSSNTAMIVKKRTSAGGRRNRGRMFMPAAALDETVIDQNGFISAASVTLLQAMWDSVYGAIVGALYIPVLFHSDGGVPTGVTQFSVESQVGTQRRRMR